MVNKKSHYHDYKKPGFTLIELLVTAGLMSVILGSVTVILYSTLKGARKAEAYGVTKTEAAFAMNAMKDVIKYSRSVVGVCGGNSIQVERLNRDRVTYSLTGNRIASQGAIFTGGNPQANLTSSAVTVGTCGATTLFTCPDPQTVNICFIVSMPNSAFVEDRATVRMESTVNLRNWGY